MALQVIIDYLFLINKHRKENYNIMNTKYSFLPQEILSTGINLEPIGIKEIAWKYEDALVVIDYIFRKGYPILGGDVYAYCEDSVETTYDSWYMNKTDSKDFVLESKNKAIEYIRNYSNFNGANYIFSITY